MSIPVIDLFAGPGGLGEGFSAFRYKGQPFFKIALSIEKDAHAHRTLELRSFFRHFRSSSVPQEYYDYISGAVTREKLFDQYPEEARKASEEAWHAELGGKEFSNNDIDKKISEHLAGCGKWVLIGGPPCQAYSLVGRARRKHDPSFPADKKHFLYREYLRIIARHRPSVFVMENVTGLLSAKVKEKGIFEQILRDLKTPLCAINSSDEGKELTYVLRSLVVHPNQHGDEASPEDFVVNAEEYGIPQTRHRIIILGIRSDIASENRLLKKREAVPIEKVISDLPKLRSGLSKQEDSATLWYCAVTEAATAKWLDHSKIDVEVRCEILRSLAQVKTDLTRGGEFVPRARRIIHAHAQWFSDDRLQGICNHSTRAHIPADLHRYLFVSAFARVKGRSPKLHEFPPGLLPLHKNIADAIEEGKFNDRFRVQLAGKPSTTIMAHISKDGHYFIHYDPTQCRSLTVREAARLQTFPDNYFFEGPRTQQYLQVGNAVPPMLAYQIAKIVSDLFL